MVLDVVAVLVLVAPVIAVPATAVVTEPPPVVLMVLEILLVNVFVAPAIAVPETAVETLPPPAMDKEAPVVVVFREPPPVVLIVLDVVPVIALVAPVIVLAEAPATPIVLVLPLAVRLPVTSKVLLNVVARDTPRVVPTVAAPVVLIRPEAEIVVAPEIAPALEMPPV